MTYVVHPRLNRCLSRLTKHQLYLVHWPVAFQKGESYFPLVANSNVEGGDVIIDNDVSIVDTWKGMSIRYMTWDEWWTNISVTTAMTQLPKSKVRSVGVSNHAIEHVRETTL